MSEAIWFKSR